VRGKLPDMEEAWITACFLAKNVMKFLNRLLLLLFEKGKLSLRKKFLTVDRIFHTTAHGGMNIKMKME